MKKATNYWLVKSDPETYSWEKLLKEGVVVWDGVRNFQARNNLKSMKNGDLVFFYHSKLGKDIRGIAKVVREAYADPKDAYWSAVDLQPVNSLKRSISLDEIKSDKRLQNIGLVRQSRLSVMPVNQAEFDVIYELSTQ